MGVYDLDLCYPCFYVQRCLQDGTRLVVTCTDWAYFVDTGAAKNSSDCLPVEDTTKKGVEVADL